MMGTLSAVRQLTVARLSLVLSLALALSMTMLGLSRAMADHNGLHVTDLTDTDLDPEDLADALAGEGVTIDPTSVAFIGDDRAGGTFSGGAGIIGFEGGIILSSGQAVDVVGPNESPATTTAFGTPGDAALTVLAGVDTFDAAILEFDFEADADAEQVFFNYVFGSEEYNEFVGSAFNDVFAFWVNDVNCAVVPDPDNGVLPVSVNTVNNGQPGVDPTNPGLYINNDPFHPDSTGETVPAEDLLNTEMDGLTVVLLCEADVAAGTNTMRMGIADGSDEILDSWVLIEAGSLTTTPPEPVEPVEPIEESAWADGTRFAERGNWATYFEHRHVDPDHLQVQLFAAQDTAVGIVHTVRGGTFLCEADELHVRYATEGDVFLTEIHFVAAHDLDGIPTNRAGNPQPGQFDKEPSGHSDAFDLADQMTLVEFCVPHPAPGGDIVAAAHAVVALMP